MTAKTIIGARLRAEREDRRWSRETLARRFRRLDPKLPSVASLTHMIKEWEAGKHEPRQYRELYAEVFGMDVGVLFDPRRPMGGPLTEIDLGDVLTPDDAERVVLALRQPARLDPVVVRSLAEVLAVQRRQDDVLGPRAVLPVTLINAAAVSRLLREARGPVRDVLAPVAAEWVQFAGWLHAEARDDEEAIHTLADAEDMAEEIGDGVLVAQAVNFKGYLARQQRRPHGMVRQFMTAYHTPGASAAQRLGDAVQAAQGYALLGERADARAMIAAGEALEAQAARESPPGTAYWLTPDFQHINLGLALLGLGEHRVAAEHMRHGLGSLPAEWDGAEWSKEYREALALAEDGG